MIFYITIDGGTTNTRINLVKDRQIIDNVKLSVGARSTIDNKDLLKNELKRSIHQLLEKNSLSEKDIKRVLASGMITSEFGLCNLPHIETPAGIYELHNHMHETIISEITNIPFVFIRGVKTLSQDFENTDMMRGEETELMGIFEACYGTAIYVLPGSHSKIIRIDTHGRICDFSTMLTGEMIASLSQNTILKDAVDLSVTNTDTEYLLKGYDYCCEVGINQALFKVRVLKNIFKKNKEEIYSFCIGIILCNEIRQIINSDEQTVVLGGKAQLKKAMATILQERTDKKIIILDEKTVASSTATGAIKIFEKDGM